MTVSNQAAQRCLNRVFKEREHLHIVDYADEHFFLSAASSNSKGQRWKTHGYQKMVLHAFTDLGTRRVAVKKSVQVGITKSELVCIIYDIVQRFRSTGVWLPRRSDADEFSNVQIQSALEDMPDFASALKTDIDKKDKDNTTRRRAFKGAQSYCRATQTPQDVSSISVQSAYVDELSKMPRTIRAGKADKGVKPTDGIRGRMDAEKWWKLNMLSSCLEYGACAITEEYEACREKFERWHACPGCDTYQIMEWGDEKTAHGFKFDKQFDENGMSDDLLTAETVYYQCAHCDHKIKYRDMSDIDDYRGEYRSQKLRFDEKQYKYFKLEDEEGSEPVDSPYSVGIQIRGWFSRTKSWQEGMFQFLCAARAKSEGDTQPLINWVQDYKGEAYRPPEDHDQVKHAYLMARQESYLAECPEEVQAITGWWDLQQAGYIFGLYVGWGYKEECWLLKTMMPLGCPIRSTVMRDNIIPMCDYEFRKPSGAKMPVLLTGIDAGWQGELAHDLAKSYSISKIIPTFGGRKIGAPVAMAPREPSAKTGTFLTELCPDTAKTTIYTRYKTEEPGPGYIHIPDDDSFDESLIKQLVSEKRGLINNVRRWICPDGVRNEGLDAMVGNLGLIRILQHRAGLKLLPPDEYVQPISEQEEIENDLSIEEMAALARA